MRQPLVLPLILLALCAPALSRAAVVENVRTYRSPEYTRLVFELDQGLEHKVFTLENPDRVVIDLAGTRLRDTLEEPDLNETPITGIRSAPRNDGDLRIVLDLRGKVQPRSFLLARNEQHGDRLVIDLYDSNTAVAAAEPVVSISSADLQDSKRDIVVAISAGHGGEDHGAIGVNRLREKNVVLAIAREVEERINATPGYRAVMIRNGDYYVGLREQIQIAHANNANLFIAIHADAHTNSDASGSTVYALSQNGATSEQARLLAEKENASDLIGGVGTVSLNDKDEVLRSVLLDLSMNASIATSLEIGDQVIHSLANVVRMRRRNVEQAAFVVLKSADIPSLLVESGYITNTHDARNLDSPAWRRDFAGALTDGIMQWFYERPPQGSWVAWQKKNGGFVPATYTVKRGDTLSQIAENYAIPMSRIRATNELKSDSIQVGQVLKIPTS